MLFSRELWVYNVVAYWFLVYWILGVAKTNFGSPFRNNSDQKGSSSNLDVLLLFHYGAGKLGGGWLYGNLDPSC